MPSNPFTFHTGIEAQELHNDQWRMDCPFCGKEQHFYFNPEKDFAWDCKVCGLKGNTYTFLNYVLERCVQDFSELKKGLPTRALTEAGVRYNRMNQTYIIPTYREGRLNNLYKYVPSNNTIFGTPSLQAALFNWDETTEDTVWLCEGHWDKIAGDAIIGTGKPITAIGVPGANTFKETWCGALRDKTVVLIYDNDAAGERGVQRVLEILKKSPQKPKKVQRVIWPTDVPEKFDLRDHYIRHGRAAYRELEPLIKDIEDNSIIKVTVDNVIEDFGCDSYDKALESFQSAFYTTDDMKAALALVMASIWSVNFDGLEQVWLKIVGPPGCGKTSIAKAVSASDQVVNRSTFTGLFSGWKDEKEEDASLIPLISGRTLIVKDADALLRQPNVEQIFSEMRDFYDKNSEVSYRNRQQFNYRNIKSTFIICGTQVLRSADHSFLGERFLTVELDVTPSEKRVITRRVMEKSMRMALKQEKDPEIKIMSSMKGWINHLMQRECESTIPDDLMELLMDLSHTAAAMRASVNRNYRDDVTSPAMSELPTRIMGQIVAATLALCVVLGKTKADQEVFTIINKLFRDTINPRSRRFKICKLIMEEPDASPKDIREALGINEKQFDREIDDLRELGLITLGKRPATGSPGRYARKFILSDEIKTGLAELR